ncbi:cobyric acid synthase [Paenibacillus sp. WLX2291]|uniref:cobyric acid synthase n=1 Tax=Paenibacillus sp. WLX2291 TaxID=3296934 RepID=UPI0039844FFC
MDKQAAVIMLQGTASDVGKSMIATALCRLFSQDGWRTAPFKSQNMANNSYVTLDGKEIGRAQGVQAEACGLAATTDMNPILIKPTGDMHSQIVVHGKPYAQMSAWTYREDFLPQAQQLVMDALNRLRAQQDIVVIEGAGSPAEINLKSRDIVNMNLAGWADAPVLLIADIDRGGVFASLVGTLQLLEPHEREQVKGLIINKFRGDPALLQPGIDWLEQYTGIPVLGVLPHDTDLQLDAEDSLALETRRYHHDPAKELDIAVIRYPRISNFTDFDMLEAEPDVSVRYVEHAGQLGVPDVVILPGSKDTLSDLQYMRERGLDVALQQLRDYKPVPLIGICGGYQMLGYTLTDPGGYDSPHIRTEPGLNWLPVTTVFASEKKTVVVEGHLRSEALRMLEPISSEETTPALIPVTGYEIHMGETICAEMEHHQPLFTLNHVAEVVNDEEVEESDTASIITSTSERSTVEDSKVETDWQNAGVDGCISPDGSVWGTYLHGIFDNDLFRRHWLNMLRQQKGLEPYPVTVQTEPYRQQAFDHMAELVREHLDMEQICEIVRASIERDE